VGVYRDGRRSISEHGHRNSKRQRAGEKPCKVAAGQIGQSWGIETFSHADLHNGLAWLGPGERVTALARPVYSWHDKSCMSNKSVARKKRGRPATGETPHI